MEPKFTCFFCWILLKAITLQWDLSVLDSGQKLNLQIVTGGPEGGEYTKRIQGMKDLNYHQRLEKLKLPSLEYRRLRGDLIEVYKITHSIYYPISTNTMFHMSSNQPNTRFNLNPYRLTKAHVNKKQSQMFFTNRVVDLWNNLPLNVVTSKSLNVFKNNVDSHFKEVMYTTNFSFSLYIKHNLQ